MSYPLSPILRQHTQWSVMFWCPGCQQMHAVVYDTNPHNPQGPKWFWNRSVDKPTFTPSLLVTYEANPEATEEFKEWRTKRICHSFITDGKIQFLGDCTHELANKTVDIPNWPEN